MIETESWFIAKYDNEENQLCFSTKGYVDSKEKHFIFDFEDDAKKVIKLLNLDEDGASVHHKVYILPSNENDRDLLAELYQDFMNLEPEE
jgi:hypothetical protein